MSSCFFCESNYHVSHYCDIYVTNESREDIITSKKRCSNCLAYLRFNCVKCKRRQKCYICFSKNHPTIYCPDRLKAPIIFPPKIDEDLFLRFSQILKREEIWSLAFSHPNMFEVLKLKPIEIKITEKCVYSNVDTYIRYDLIIADKVEVMYGIANRPDTYIKLLLNPPIFHVKYLDIQCSDIFTPDFLVLLSSKTIHLQCSTTKFHPEIVFRELLEKAPKLEDIDIFQTNIKADNLWPDDIFYFNKADNLRSLHFSIPADLNFNVESIIALLKKTTVKVNVFIAVSNYANIRESIKTLKTMLPKQQFIPRQHWQKDTRICFVFRLERLDSIHYDCYAFVES